MLLHRASKGRHPQRKKIIKTVTGVALLFVVVLVGLSAWRAVGLVTRLKGETRQCTEGREKLFAHTQSIADEFNAIKFLPGQPDASAQISHQDGDCTDSLPTIFATKTYSLPAPAGTTFDQMTSALAAAGFEPQAAGAEDNFLNPCSYAERKYSFAKPGHGRTVDISLSCTRDSPNGDQQAWRQITVTKATASLSVVWDYTNHTTQ